MGLTLRDMAREFRWGHRRLVPRSVEQVADEPKEFPTDWARTPAARLARALILRGGFAPLLHFELDAKVHGLDVLDDLPPPVLFAANHSSHLDAPLLLTSLPASWRNKTAVGGAADYFFDVWWRAVGTALAFNTFPVERSGVRRSAGAAKRLIQDGWSILVFPEGTRSHDGWFGEFRHGASFLAIQNQVPIVPIALRGTYQAMPRGRGWPASGRPQVNVRFGRPLYPEKGERARELSARLKQALAFGLQEDRASWWDAMRDGSDSLESVEGPDAPRWRRMWESSRPLERRERERVWPR